jgi:hypothetical protein
MSAAGKAIVETRTKEVRASNVRYTYREQSLFIGFSFSELEERTDSTTDIGLGVNSASPIVAPFGIPPDKMVSAPSFLRVLHPFRFLKGGGHGPPRPTVPAFGFSSSSSPFFSRVATRLSAGREASPRRYCF